jgi:hypothetical protein
MFSIGDFDLTIEIFNAWKDVGQLVNYAIGIIIWIQNIDIKRSDMFDCRRNSIIQFFIGDETLC